MPSSVFFGIEITRRCNLQCPHCYTGSGGRAAHPGPDPEAVKKLVGELAAVGIRSVAFSGGEPLLRQDLEDLIRFGRAQGVPTFGLVTNGVLATPERVRSLAKAGLRTVQVSIDGVDAIDHCQVRACKPGDYYRALRAVRLFRDAGLNVHIATILSPRNASRAAEMALLCESLGVRGLRYCSYVPAGRGSDDAMRERYAVPDRQLDEFVQLMRKLSSHPNAPLRIMIDHGIGPWRESGKFHCEAGNRVAYCSSEGNLYPCPGFIFDEFVVGNVFETPIAELLGREELSRPRQVMRTSVDGMCSTCPNNDCSGGCRGAAYASTRSIKAEPAYCFFRSKARGSEEPAEAPAAQ
jgi:AdoMet-dependent heme synthase